MRGIQPVRFLAALAVIALTAAACEGADVTENGDAPDDPIDDADADDPDADADADAATDEEIEEQLDEEEVPEDATAVTIAAVNNPQMQDMNELADRFNDEQDEVFVQFVILPEEQLRDRVTQDVATEAGQFDIVTIGNYEAPIWAANGWLTNLSEFYEGDDEYDHEDFIEPVRDTLSHEGDLHAVPFYGESSFLMYQEEIFEEEGIEMPERPTWDEVADIARELHDPDENFYGICLRGAAGWGANLAPLNTVVNTFGGIWYDMDWNAQLDQPEFIEAVQFYVDLLDEAGQPDPASDSFTECLPLFAGGDVAMWYDATSAVTTVEDPDASDVAGNVGYAYAPVRDTDAAGWLWAWAMAIPASSDNQEAAWEFVRWSTSKDYHRLVGEEIGWERTPPGARESTYDIPEYQEVSEAYGDIYLDSMLEVDAENPGVEETPYIGIQWIGIPEFQDLGTDVSQEIADAIAGNQSVEDAMEEGQRLAEQVAEQGGYRD
jgi:sorbitol/mannitol transport system substrate-binding protein